MFPIDKDSPIQLELFSTGPFTLRWPMPDALAFFWANYWCFLPKAKTSKKPMARLVQFFAGRYADEISKTDVEALRRHLASLGLKANTINTHHVLLTRFFNKLAEWKEGGSFNGLDFSKITLPLKNPGSLVPKVDERQFARKVAWPKRLVYKLINVANVLNLPEVADAIEILYLSKLRPGDVWNLSERNIDFAHMILSGIQHKTITSRMPSGIPYMIALTPRMATILKRRLAEGEPLFSKKRVEAGFKIVRKAAGARLVQIRDFRPSSATLLLDNGIDPETVSESLGHTTPRMLPTYAPRSIVHQRKAQAVLEKEETEILY